MLDDLIEIVVDLGGELLGGILERRGKKREKPGNPKTDAAREEPWEQEEKKPPWEE